MILKTVETFLSTLNRQGIRYCHWKSNLNVGCALMGEDDLDILVHPEDKEEIESILKTYKILRLYSEKDKWQPKIFHFVGWDQESKKLFHVHLHFGLVLGFDYDKNIELPITANYLENLTLYKGIINLPEREKEYLILVIRLILKNDLGIFLLKLPPAQLRAIKTQNKGIIKGGGYREFMDLHRQINRDRLKEILQKEVNIVSWDLFTNCEGVLLKNNSLSGYFRIARQLHKALKTMQLKSQTISIIRAFKRLTTIRFRTLYGKITGRRPDYGKVNAQGGRIIAFVGGDGAGKSTNIKTAKKVLSRHFKTRTIHVGRPPKSFQGLLIKVGRKGVLLFRKKKLAAALQFLAIAYDRKNAFSKAVKMRQKGYIVLQDRIPLKGITTMDCPRIRLVAGGRFTRLIKLEEKLYQKIKGVDELIVLKLNPEIALQRRPEDNPEELRQRSGQIWNDEWVAPYAKVIDTGEFDKDEVQKKVLEIIWKSLSKPYRRLEILGLNGTGKSTLCKFTEENEANVTTVLSLKPYPILVLKSFLKNGIKLLGFQLSYKSSRLTRGLFSLKTQIEILKTWKRHPERLPSTHFFVDQGPVFGMALAIKEGYWNRYFSEKDKNLIQWFFREIVILEAPVNELFKRVKNRDQDVRSREMSFENFKVFCEEYELVFRDLRELWKEGSSSSQTLNKTPEQILKLIDDKF